MGFKTLLHWAKIALDSLGRAYTGWVVLTALGVSAGFTAGIHSVLHLHGWWIVLFMGGVAAFLAGVTGLILERRGFQYRAAWFRELNRQRRILTKLHTEFVLTHEDASPRVKAKTDPLPNDWVERRLTEMGEGWRWTHYPVE